MQPLAHEVRAWHFQDILLESYAYAPGKAEAGEPHIHADYQICLSLDFPGVYAYRGVRHAVPAGSLSVLHPGEIHASADPEERLTYTHYRLFYLPPSLLRQAAYREGQAERDPFFPDPVLLSDDLLRDFLRLHRLLGSAAPRLEQESRLQSQLARFIARYADSACPPPAFRPEQSVVRRVKSYIEDNYDGSIALADLARLAERHPVYLNAMFRQAVGVPPHAYQTQVRVDRAKRLLARGMSISAAAQEVGFCDQSHLGKYFHRYTGVTPARYRALKTS